MTTRFQAFAALHVPGDPVVLYNIWDAGSAQAVIRAGAKALATGSHPVADANGWPDGQGVPIEFALANARRIADSTDLPLTVDFESAYSEDPQAGADNVVRLADTGAIGCNFEDQVIGGEGRPSAQNPGQAYRGDPPRRRRRLLHQRPHRPLPEDAGA
jgi:2-methylisocitrate lyase-like PEP mutase family enzyme